MSELKNKILHDIVEPNKEKFKTSTFVGEVVKTYNCNRCKVDFIDKSGNTIKGKILPIRNYSDVSYLPSLNDKVIIKQEVRS